MSAEKITYATLTASDAIHAPFEKALKDNELNYGKHYPMYIGDREVMADDEFATKSPIDSDDDNKPIESSDDRRQAREEKAKKEWIKILLTLFCCQVTALVLK